MDVNESINYIKYSKVSEIVDSKIKEYIRRYPNYIIENEIFTNCGNFISLIKKTKKNNKYIILYFDYNGDFMFSYESLSEYIKNSPYQKSGLCKNYFHIIHKEDKELLLYEIKYKELILYEVKYKNKILYFINYFHKLKELDQYEYCRIPILYKIINGV